MLTGMKWCVLAAVLVTVEAERWQWPDEAESVRIDTKVRFTDTPRSQKATQFRPEDAQADDVPFREPTDTEGFYNRPPGAGRYPVRVLDNKQDQQQNIYNRFNRDQEEIYDGTLDSLPYCKCVSTPNCNIKMNTNACGPNQYLCCYDAPRAQQYHNSELFNEVNSDQLLYPGQPNRAGPFPPPSYSETSVFGPTYGQNNVLFGPNQPNKPNRPHTNTQQVLVGPGGPTGIIGPNKGVLIGAEDSDGAIRPNKGVLVGPGGPTGIIGPNKGVLVGPEGPTGIIGPNKGVLVGPGGPTGIIGPNKGVLVGPGGPTGIIGPNNGIGPQAQHGVHRTNKGVLVGPGGPTGIIGPNKGVLVGPGGPTGIIGPNKGIGLQGSNGVHRPNKGVLVGPGGPTGVIGPSYQNRDEFFESEDLSTRESAQRGVLVGPGGPTGIIGPGYNNRPVLVGPGGPTGIIGPRRPGVLVGPGGPTGVIGPYRGSFGSYGSNRPILVGPGGPTGQIGPYGYGK